MNVSRIRALRGPNLWSRNTAIEAIVQCEEAERSIAALPGFEARLRELFPTIGALPAARDSSALSMADALEAAALALQAQAGCPVTFSRTTATVEPGVYLPHKGGVRIEDDVVVTADGCRSLTSFSRDLITVGG